MKACTVAGRGEKSLRSLPGSELCLMKACTVAGRGEKSLRSHPGSELCVGREKEKEKVPR